MRLVGNEPRKTPAARDGDDGHTEPLVRPLRDLAAKRVGRVSLGHASARGGRE